MKARTKSKTTSRNIDRQRHKRQRKADRQNKQEDRKSEKRQKDREKDRKTKGIHNARQKVYTMQDKRYTQCKTNVNGKTTTFFGSQFELVHAYSGLAIALIRDTKSLKPNPNLYP
jgi:hypothetical protein